jgi:hypothetical protein
MIAQRACLDWVVQEIRLIPGSVLEVGLGNGRTYDHLRSLLAGRPIHAFDRHLVAHPDCVPPPDLLRIGDIRTTLPLACPQLAPAVLIHSDIGTGDEMRNAELAAEIAPLYGTILDPGGFVLSSQPLLHPWLEAALVPTSITQGRYHIYRRALHVSKTIGSYPQMAPRAAIQQISLMPQRVTPTIQPATTPASAMI